MWGLVAFILFGNQAIAVDLAQVETELKTTGAIGFIHGSNVGSGLFVFTYRNPKDFFDHYEFPITTEDSVVAEFLKKLRRHDKVKITGSYATHSAPQKHILAQTIELVKAYEEDGAPPVYSSNPKIRDEVLAQSELIGRVHALGESGKVLVIEYKDLVLPVVVKNPKLTEALYRGDRIKISYTVKSNPKDPTHIVLALTGDSITMLEKILTGNGSPIEIKGDLVFFAKSPQLIFPVFAVQPESQDEAPIQYTLVNFDNPDVFKKIREKLTSAWDSKRSSALPMRNRWMNPKIKISAKGIKNVSDPNQANPQVLLSKPEDVEITLLP